MLRKRVVSSVLCGFVLLWMAGCSRTPSVAEANRLLEGRWEPAIGHDCSDYGIKPDVLVLHGDSSLERHFLSTYGQRCDATDQHWSYLPENNIHFDTRKNFLTKQPPDKTIGRSIHETLLVEFGKPSLIVLDPHGDCLYRKIGNG
jgi:hypothetical protein